MKTCIKPTKDDLIQTEWLLTNGLGAFASGTISGIPTRKYHSYLISALPAPHGRVQMLNYVQDSLLLPSGEEFFLSSVLKDPKDNFNSYLTEFRVENALPIWRYEIQDVILEKNIFMIHGQNSVQITYNLISSKEPVEIKWRPYLHYRRNDQSIKLYDEKEKYSVKSYDHNYEIGSHEFILRLYNDHPDPFQIDPQLMDHVFYKIEFERGYDYLEMLTSPGFYKTTLSSGNRFTILASTEPWEVINVLSSSDAMISEKVRRHKLLKQLGNARKSPLAGKLAAAADQFLFTPISRTSDLIRLRAEGGEARSVIAGFPWFTDWGRDTMISLEGLTLSTGRHHEAFSILCTFAYYVRNGLIPNMFPEGEQQGLYHTADATLWFFHAAHRYIQSTGDTEILEILLPKFHIIIDEHIRGTRFGIKADKDGLMHQGDKNHPLTWMDAKVGDWIVTPRRGKAVEINALWYNALKLFELWTGRKIDITERCYESFNKRFWNPSVNHLYDIVDGEHGDDPAHRPNQLFAISLDYPVLDQSRWQPVLTAVQNELLTPFGLRTLSPAHPDYKAQYDGDLRSRDAAYHQGTVWPWLIGPFIDSWLKVYPDDFKTAAGFLKGIENHLENHCIGTINEIFDAQEPYHARGCNAQAWSVAEVLRCLIKVHPMDGMET